MRLKRPLQYVNGLRKDFLLNRSANQFFVHSILVALLVICGFLWLDEWTTHLLSEEQRERYYQPLRKLTDLGESTHYFIVSALCYLIANLNLHFRKTLNEVQIQFFQLMRRWGAILFSSLIVGGMIVHLIKFLVGRQRPHLSEGYEAFIFSPLNIHWHFQSFPSGHSQTLFTAAVAFAIAFPKRRGALLLVAALLASTRIWLHQHFFSDVILGSFIGYQVTTFFFNRYFKKK